MSVWLTLDSFRSLCFELAAQAQWIASEPIPHFDTRFPGRLEACLAAPRQTFDGELLYPTLLDQAAILFYLLDKNHAFANGNKRIAVTALMVFLFLNGKWLTAPNEELHDLALSVAASEAREKDQAVARIRLFLQEYVGDVANPAAPLHE
jgi:death-on-curing protein